MKDITCYIFCLIWDEVNYERDIAWDEYFGMKDARDQLRDRLIN